MQTDESAFEGWCVVLKAALPGIEHVILNWDTPAYAIGKESAQKAHYNRFLMRAANFRRAYLWFKVADNRKNEKKPEAVLERKLVDRGTDHGRWSFLARHTIM